MRLANGTYVRVLVLYVIGRAVRQTWIVISDALACRPCRCTYDTTSKSVSRFLRSILQRLFFCVKSIAPLEKTDGSDACVFHRRSVHVHPHTTDHACRLITRHAVRSKTGSGPYPFWPCLHVPPMRSLSHAHAHAHADKIDSLLQFIQKYSNLKL